jgi:hypothetical protein
MKMDISQVVCLTNQLQLKAPGWYYKTLNKKPELIDKIANGVGSETSWTYHLTPDTVWFLNINPSSHDHDLMYTFPLKFESVGDGLAWKRLADYYFELNCKKQIEDVGGYMEQLRLSRIEKYKTALEIGGSEAFWANKMLPSDYYKYYEKQPDFNENKFNMYKDVWEEIANLAINDL